MPVRAIMKEITMQAMPSCFAKTDSFFCRGVFSLPIACVRRAIFPIWVDIPVFTTRPLPQPSTTSVPIKHMFFCAKISLFSAILFSSFNIAIDSPVSMASSTLKLFDSNSLISAGTLSPASMITTSPGTSSLESIILSFPSLITLLLVTAIFFRDLIAFSAFISSTKPKIAFKTTIAKMVIASMCSPTKKEMRAATRRTMIKGLVNWLSIIFQRGVFSSSLNSFFP